jgi:hypothetical protein
LMEPDSPRRQAQLAGFERVRSLMLTKRPAAEIAAERLLSYLH